jgi:hypothetical protein
MVGVGENIEHVCVLIFNCNVQRKERDGHWPAILGDKSLEGVNGGWRTKAAVIELLELDINLDRIRMNKRVPYIQYCGLGSILRTQKAKDKGHGGQTPDKPFDLTIAPADSFQTETEGQTEDL